MSGSSDSYEQRDGLRGLPLELMVSCETGEGSSSSWMISLLTSLLITTSDSVGSSGGSGGSLFGQKLPPQKLMLMLSPSESEEIDGLDETLLFMLTRFNYRHTTNMLELG